MPNRGSWNNKWSDDGSRFIRTMHNKEVPKELWGNEYFYRWDDGWCACVSVNEMDYKSAKKLKKKSAGFCGYDWMIKSLIAYKKIKKLQ